MGFIEIDDVPRLVREITHTTAWTALAPAFGLPDQLKLIGPAGTLLSATGLGPQEAVVLSQTQILVVVTAIEAAGSEVHPQFTLILETHAASQSADRIRKSWVPLLAERIYGGKVREETRPFHEIIISEYLPSIEGHSILAANTGSLIYISNDRSSIEECLKSKLGETESVKMDPSFTEAKRSLSADAQVFGFASRDGIGRFAKLLLYILGGRFESALQNAGDFEPSIQDAIGGLFDGFAYSMSFEKGTVVEQRLLLLRADTRARLTEILRPSARPPLLHQWIPSSAYSASILRLNEPGQAIEDLLALVSSKSNVVTSVLLREAVIAMRKRYGLRPSDEISKALGDEFAWIRLDEHHETAFCATIRDPRTLEAFLPRFLSLRQLSSDSVHNGARLFTSRSDSNDALLITNPYLVLGTEDDAISLADSPLRGLPLPSDLIAGKLMVTFENDAPRSATAILEISRIFRTTDGTLDHLEDPAVKAAISAVPRSISYLELLPEGLKDTARSPLGWLPSLISLFPRD